MSASASDANNVTIVHTEIVLAHAKALDHSRYIRLLRAYHCKAPLLLYTLTREQLPNCLPFLRTKLAQ